MIRMLCLTALFALPACAFDQARAQRADDCAATARDMPKNAGKPFKSVWSECYRGDRATK